METESSTQKDLSVTGKKSRHYYTAECAFEYLVSLLVAGSFLAAIFNRLGVNDGVTGIISTIISLAYLFQLVSIPLISKIVSTKRFALPLHTLGQLLFAGVFFAPFLPISQLGQQIFSITCLLLAYLFKNMATNVIFRWGNAFVSPTKRVSYNMLKEIISLVSGMIASLAYGYIFDELEASEKPDNAFVFVAVMILLASALDTYTLFRMQDIRHEEAKTERTPLITIFKDIMARKGFRKSLYMTTLNYVSIYLMSGFTGTLMTNDLSMSMTLISIVSIVACGARALVSPFFGKYGDKKGFVKCYLLGHILYIIGLLALMFTTKATWWLVIAFQIFYNAAFAGTNSNLMNLTYSYVPERYFAEAASIRYSISGLISFLISIPAGLLLDAIQSNGNTFLGLNVFGQQVLAFIALIVAIINFIYVKVSVQKEPVMIQ